VKPNFIYAVRTQDGETLYQSQTETYPALDPRVAFIMTDMLQEVLRSGTGAAVRARGFNLPAAGKTGTSHDGWFAGYTSQLLCVVWVGFDDYRELGLEGAKSALPIWAAFMMDAARYHDYRDAKPFTPPSGVIKASSCGGAADYYIEGSQPAPCPPPDHVFFPAGEADRSIPPDAEQNSQAVPVAAPPPPPRQPPPTLHEPAPVPTAMPPKTPQEIRPSLPVKTPPEKPSMPVKTPETKPLTPARTPPALPIPIPQERP
jgi:penicillin-binding protein 1B